MATAAAGAWALRGLAAPRRQYCWTPAALWVAEESARAVLDCLAIYATLFSCSLAQSNLLEQHADPVMAAVRCSCDMAIAARAPLHWWRVRAGIHIGPVVAGVVGRTKFSFDLWGESAGGNRLPRSETRNPYAAMHSAAW